MDGRKQNKRPAATPAPNLKQTPLNQQIERRMFCHG